MLWLPGLPTLPLEVARQEGLFSVIKPHSNIKVVATAAGGYLAAPALTATSNVLRAHPDLNVVVSSGDQMIAGAYKAEQLAGKAGKVANVGNGCTVEAKQLILDGKETACSVYLPMTEGRLVVQALVDAVERLDARPVSTSTRQAARSAGSAQRPTSPSSRPSSIRSSGLGIPTGRSVRHRTRWVARSGL